MIRVDLGKSLAASFSGMRSVNTRCSIRAMSSLERVKASRDADSPPLQSLTTGVYFFIDLPR